MAVVLLTFNSEAIIERTIIAAARVGGRIVAVDSGSKDRTQSLLAAHGCEVLERPFLNYADQRNWVIEALESRFDWQLHLDADEVLDERAIASIREALAQARTDVVYMLHRRTYFMGCRLRYGGTATWHLRLFRSGSGRCEDRLYDQHFVSTLPRVRLAGWLDDLNAGTLAEWTTRHNRWTSLEAEEMTRQHSASSTQVRGRLSSDPRERQRFYKGAYYRLPRGWRAIGHFLYRYVVLLGFLDGSSGFYYAVLQALWFRVLIDAKLAEIESTRRVTIS